MKGQACRADCPEQDRRVGGQGRLGRPLRRRGAPPRASGCNQPLKGGALKLLIRLTKNSLQQACCCCPQPGTGRGFGEAGHSQGQDPVRCRRWSVPSGSERAVGRVQHAGQELDGTGAPGRRRAAGGRARGARQDQALADAPCEELDGQCADGSIDVASAWPQGRSRVEVNSSQPQAGLDVSLCRSSHPLLRDLARHRHSGQSREDVVKDARDLLQWCEGLHMH
mmetsp:Transcript_47516/g.135622  ORF Transcript_47516/g.135622 Transcript_47516/m.135622 type:complete len:224 (-) Transcript_47516:80-751(-)